MFGEAQLLSLSSINFTMLCCCIYVSVSLIFRLKLLSISLVSRIEARCHDGETSIQLDINSELYPIQPRELYRMVISKTLNMDGSAVTSHPPEVFVPFTYLNLPL